MLTSRKLALLALAIGVSVGCAAGNRVYSWSGASRLTDFDSSMSAASLIEIQWWTIWQDTPVWHIVITPDGRMIETIERRGKQRKERRRKVRPESLEAIARLASEVRFFQLDRHYKCSEEDAGKVFLGMREDDWEHGVVLDGPYDEWCFECTAEMERFAILWNAIVDEVAPGAGGRNRNIWRLKCDFDHTMATGNR